MIIACIFNRIRPNGRSLWLRIQLLIDLGTAYVTDCNVTMTNRSQARLKNLGEVEQLVMDFFWSHGPGSSEACREALAASRPMKDSTIRTVLRRLEEKGYLTHETEGRTFIYRASDARQNVAVRAVKGIIDRFCGGPPKRYCSAWWTTQCSTGNNWNGWPAKSGEKKETEP